MSDSRRIVILHLYVTEKGKDKVSERKLRQLDSAFSSAVEEIANTRKMKIIYEKFTLVGGRENVDILVTVPNSTRMTDERIKDLILDEYTLNNKVVGLSVEVNEKEKVEPKEKFMYLYDKVNEVINDADFGPRISVQSVDWTDDTEGNKLTITFAVKDEVTKKKTKPIKLASSSPTTPLKNKKKPAAKKKRSTRK